MTAAPPPPITDHLPISLRAFACPPPGPQRPKKLSWTRRAPPPASEWALIFDCETNADASQRLRFGTYQVRQGDQLRRSGLFFDPNALSSDEFQILRDYASRNRLALLTRDEFADQIFYGIGYDLRASIIGFNLPFDISRIAIRHGPARGNMRGGFTFHLTRDKRRPQLRVKHLSSKAAFIDFAAPFKQRSNRSVRKKGRKEPINRGHFVDVKTLAFALFARPFKLATLCEFLNIENRKLQFEDFSAPVSNEMLDYAVRDTQATWECYRALIAKYDGLGLPQTRPEKIYSEASVGKAYLKEMGLKPWQRCQPDFDPGLIGAIMSSYFGGRSEIRIRRETRQVMLCDFLSMYPTVCTLMGLWRYVIAAGIHTRDATIEARELLASISIEKLQSQASWKELAMLVRVKPDADIFPVRAHYEEAQQATIGLNKLAGGSLLWFTLADCIASKLLTGKSPEIIEAIGFLPKEIQSGLCPVTIGGNANYAIDPATDDFYKRLIELRQETKAEMKAASGIERAKLHTEQNALKIAANATSYGIFVELNVADARSKQVLRVYHSGNEPFDRELSKVEKPGTYFHPLLASLITGAARLMLAVTEILGDEKGLDWSFCDTDSMALAKPAGMDGKIFATKIEQIIDWFADLNPYAFEGSILKSESVNYALDGGGSLEPLYCWAVSAKRYALFNLGDDGEPISRKASAHGLGHLRAPYTSANPAAGIAPPRDHLSNIGVELWQHDLWLALIKSALAGTPDQVDLSYHPALAGPAISRYTATSPQILAWFKRYNCERRYAEQVKPFGFLTALFSINAFAGEHIIEGKLRRRPKPKEKKPIAPFETDPAIAAAKAFDRNTGEPVTAVNLRTYLQALAQYHLQPENKFLNGYYLDCGTTARRHVRVTAVANIGKEANEWERQATLGYEREAQPTYGYGPDDIARLQAELKRLCEVFSPRRVARHGQMTAHRLADFIAADCRNHSIEGAIDTMESLAKFFAQLEIHERSEAVKLAVTVSERGLRKTARNLSVDPSNLRRKLRTVANRRTP